MRPKLIRLGEPLISQNAAKRWTTPVRDWTAARNQFMIRFGERMPR